MVLLGDSTGAPGESTDALLLEGPGSASNTTET
jgi:hypothetical protein